MYREWSKPSCVWVAGEAIYTVWPSIGNIGRRSDNCCVRASQVLPHWFTDITRQDMMFLSGEDFRNGILQPKTLCARVMQLFVFCRVSLGMGRSSLQVKPRRSILHLPPAQVQRSEAHQMTWMPYRNGDDQLANVCLNEDHRA